MTDAPTGSNADEWALFLSEWGVAYCAVRIAEAIEAAERRGFSAGIEAAGAEMRIVGQIASHYGSPLKGQCYEDGAKIIRALAEQEKG